VGIRREDKSVWERRAPLSPEHVKELLENNKDIQIVIQPSKKRIFSDYEYQEQGAVVSEDLSNCDIIIGIKEVPVNKFIPNTTFMFFSHTIKVTLIIIF
jgi:alpha-aminoadipic semialdehyde synthase